ncbi:hypothetical protein ACVSNF_06865, partial [Pseudomonas aeruginosa]
MHKTSAHIQISSSGPLQPVTACQEAKDTMSSKQIECDSELLASLRQATPEELDVLVDVITDYARGRAGLDADDKKALVQAKHASGCEGYSENQLKLLGHELQQFGGHSVMNL